MEVDACSSGDESPVFDDTYMKVGAHLTIPLQPQNTNVGASSASYIAQQARTSPSKILPPKVTKNTRGMLGWEASRFDLFGSAVGDRALQVLTSTLGNLERTHPKPPQWPKSDHMVGMQPYLIGESEMRYLNTKSTSMRLRQLPVMLGSLYGIPFAHDKNGDIITVRHEHEWHRFVLAQLPMDTALDSRPFAQVLPVRVFRQRLTKRALRMPSSDGVSLEYPTCWTAMALGCRRAILALIHALEPTNRDHAARERWNSQVNAEVAQLGEWLAFTQWLVERAKLEDGRMHDEENDDDDDDVDSKEAAGCRALAECLVLGAAGVLQEMKLSTCLKEFETGRSQKLQSECLLMLLSVSARTLIWIRDLKLVSQAARLPRHLAADLITMFIQTPRAFVCDVRVAQDQKSPRDSVVTVTQPVLSLWKAVTSHLALTGQCLWSLLDEILIKSTGPGVMRPGFDVILCLVFACDDLLDGPASISTTVTRCKCQDKSHFLSYVHGLCEIDILKEQKIPLYARNDDTRMSLHKRQCLRLLSIARRMSIDGAYPGGGLLNSLWNQQVPCVSWRLLEQRARFAQEWNAKREKRQLDSFFKNVLSFLQLPDGPSQNLCRVSESAFSVFLRLVQAELLQTESQRRTQALSKLLQNVPSKLIVAETTQLRYNPDAKSRDPCPLQKWTESAALLMALLPLAGRHHSSVTGRLWKCLDLSQPCSAASKAILLICATLVLHVVSGEPVDDKSRKRVASAAKTLAGLLRDMVVSLGANSASSSSSSSSSSSLNEAKQPAQEQSHGTVQHAILLCLNHLTSVVLPARPADVSVLCGDALTSVIAPLLKEGRSTLPKTVTVALYEVVRKTSFVALPFGHCSVTHVGKKDEYGFDVNSALLDQRTADLVASIVHSVSECLQNLPVYIMDVAKTDQVEKLESLVRSLGTLLLFSLECGTMTWQQVMTEFCCTSAAWMRPNPQGLLLRHQRSVPQRILVRVLTGLKRDTDRFHAACLTTEHLSSLLETNLVLRARIFNVWILGLCESKLLQPHVLKLHKLLLDVGSLRSVLHSEEDQRIDSVTLRVLLTRGEVADIKQKNDTLYDARRQLVTRVASELAQLLKNGDNAARAAVLHMLPCHLSSAWKGLAASTPDDPYLQFVYSLIGKLFACAVPLLHDRLDMRLDALQLLINEWYAPDFLRRLTQQSGIVTVEWLRPQSIYSVSVAPHVIQGLMQLQYSTDPVVRRMLVSLLGFFFIPLDFVGSSDGQQRLIESRFVASLVGIGEVDQPMMQELRLWLMSAVSNAMWTRVDRMLAEEKRNEPTTQKHAFYRQAYGQTRLWTSVVNSGKLGGRQVAQLWRLAAVPLTLLLTRPLFGNEGRANFATFRLKLGVYEFITACVSQLNGDRESTIDLLQIVSTAPVKLIKMFTNCILIDLLEICTHKCHAKGRDLIENSRRSFCDTLALLEVKNLEAQDAAQVQKLLQSECTTRSDILRSHYRQLQRHTVQAFHAHVDSHLEYRRDLVSADGAKKMMDLSAALSAVTLPGVEKSPRELVNSNLATVQKKIPPQPQWPEFMQVIRDYVTNILGTE